MSLNILAKGPRKKETERASSQPAHVPACLGQSVSRSSSTRQLVLASGLAWLYGNSRERDSEREKGGREGDSERERERERASTRERGRAFACMDVCMHLHTQTYEYVETYIHAYENSCI